MPITKRISVQNRGEMISGIRIEQQAATAAMAAKVRMWPMERRTRVM